MRSITVLSLVGVSLGCILNVALAENRCTGEQTILESAAAQEQLSTLIAAAKAAGFDNGLERDGPIGLIAPTDEAFVITLGNLGITAEELMAHPEVLKPILSYHVLLDGVSCEEPPEGDIETALEGNFVSINGSTIVDGFGDTAKIIKTIWTSNGPIYLVDRVIFPKIPESSEPAQESQGKDTTASPAPEAQTVSDTTTMPTNATTSTEPSDNQNQAARDQRLRGLWNDLLQWSDSFRPSNIFGRFFFLQV